MCHLHGEYIVRASIGVSIFNQSTKQYVMLKTYIAAVHVVLKYQFNISSPQKRA